MPLDRAAALAILYAVERDGLDKVTAVDRLEACVTPEPGEASGILLNRDEAVVAHSCIVFREVMGRNPGSAPVLGLAGRLDAYLRPATLDPRKAS